jgi:hypothetical protein
MAKIKEKADWEQALINMERSFYGNLNLICDGLNITFQLARSKNNIVFCWYLDGAWKGIYSNKDNEIGKKFGRPYKARMSDKSYQLQRSFYGKRHADKAKKEYNGQVIGYMNTWNNSSTLIRHLKTTCKEIKLITD